MATAVQLMGVGMPPILAHLIGHQNDVFTSQGSTYASANKVQGGNRHILITASNSGSALAMPQIGGGDVGSCTLGDNMIFTNILSASVVLLFNTTSLGSATTIYVDGASVTGLTGVSVASAKPLLLRPVSVSTWVGLRSA